MAIKDRLQALSGDLGESVDSAKSQQPTSGERPKTAPGQMLAFRQQMLDHSKQVESLETRLAKFDGALPTRHLDPKTVHPSRWANRHPDSFADAEFRKLDEAIFAAGGNVQAVKVRPRADGEYELVFGNRRHHSCLTRGLPLLAVIDESITDRDLFVQMEHENRERKNPSPWEQGRSYKQALDAGLWPSQNAMAGALGVSQGYISNALAVFALPESVVDAFESPNDIQFKWVKELAPLSKLDKRALADRVRAAKALEDRSAKNVYQALTAKVALDGPASTDAPPVVSDSVTVSVTGSNTKVVCKKTVLSLDDQQKLAHLVNDFIMSVTRPDPTAEAS